LSVYTAEGESEKQSSLKARLRNGLTYLLTYSLCLLNTHASNFTTGVREFGEFEPHKVGS